MVDGTVVLYTERLFRRPGEVGKWATSVAATFDLAATNAAPIRSGELANSISATAGDFDPEFGVGGNQIDIFLDIGAEHAVYTLTTTDPIFLEPGEMIPIGNKSGYEPIKKFKGLQNHPRNYIEGYEGHDWVEDAYYATARRFPGLGGYDSELDGLDI